MHGNLTVVHLAGHPGVLALHGHGLVPFFLFELQKIDAVTEAAKDILEAKTSWTVELLTDFQTSMERRGEKE